MLIEPVAHLRHDKDRPNALEVFGRHPFAGNTGVEVPLATAVVRVGGYDDVDVPIADVRPLDNEALLGRVEAAGYGDAIERQWIGAVGGRDQPSRPAPDSV